MTIENGKNTFTNLDLVSINESTGIIGEESIEIYKRQIKGTLELNISELTEYLFLYISNNGATDIVQRLSRDQKIKLLEELELIELSKHSGRIWMYNHIKELCYDLSEELRTDKMCTLDVGTLTKMLFLNESSNGAKQIIKKLSREQKNKILEELELFDLSKHLGRLWTYRHIKELCK